MALYLDDSIYEQILQIFGVTTTGDPVGDAVYLILLPHVIIFLYTLQVADIFARQHKSIKWIMVFIVYFIIVTEGYYSWIVSLSKVFMYGAMIGGFILFILMKKKGDNVSFGSGKGGTFAKLARKAGEGTERRIGDVRKDIGLDVSGEIYLNEKQIDTINQKIDLVNAAVKSGRMDGKEGMKELEKLTEDREDLEKEVKFLKKKL